MEKIPFDEAAFINGAVALDSTGHEVIFWRFSESRDIFVTKYSPESSCEHYVHRSHAKDMWTMKPKDDWIPHNGANNPIEWAKAGEFEYQEGRNSFSFAFSTDLPAIKYHWRFVTFYRLTDDWIYVLGDGTIPEAIRGAEVGEWEMRRRNGFKGTPPVKPGFYKSFWLHLGFPSDIVAVRLVKNEQDRHIRLAEAELKTASSEAGKPETEKQRLTREAWERYKARKPDPIPFAPMHENEMFEIAAAALAEHDKIWPRKK